MDKTQPLAAIQPGILGPQMDIAALLTPGKTDRHILRKWVKDGVEYAFHATKGLRRRRINS